MSSHWYRPARWLTVVVALPPQPHQYGIGLAWRGHITGLWHEAGDPWYRWHLPAKPPPALPDPPEGYELGIADDGSLIHVPKRPA